MAIVTVLTDVVIAVLYKMMMMIMMMMIMIMIMMIIIIIMIIMIIASFALSDGSSRLQPRLKHIHHQPVAALTRCAPHRPSVQRNPVIRVLYYNEKPLM